MHGGFAHGASPSTQPVVADTNVTDCGRKPAGTGPPAGPGATVVVVDEVAGAAEVEGATVVDESGAVRWPGPTPDEHEARIAATPAEAVARQHLEKVRWGTPAG